MFHAAQIKIALRADVYFEFIAAPWNQLSPRVENGILSQDKVCLLAIFIFIKHKLLLFNIKPWTRFANTIGITAKYLL